MLGRLFVGLFAYAIATLIGGGAAFAQNLLVNGDFQAGNAQIGSNLNADISPWNAGRPMPTSGDLKIIALGHDLIAVDGAGGPNIINNLYPQSDAAGVGGSQRYIDPTGLDVYSMTGGAHYFALWQYFTPTCDGVLTASAAFSSVHSFSAGELSVFPVVGGQVSTAGLVAGDVLQNPDTTQLRAAHSANKASLNLQGGAGGQNWEVLSQTYTVQANQSYAYVVMPSQLSFVDNAAAVLDCTAPSPQLSPLDISLEKTCGRGSQQEHEGQSGIGWDCEIKVTASPTPFSGSFTFTEDASAVTGSSNASIVGVVQQGSDWTCAPSVPTPATDCTISGGDFDPSGVETLGFHLFAQTGAAPIEWRNCVSGTYTTASGEARDIKGNCEARTWTPPVVSTPPRFHLKKGCRLVGVQGDDTVYACAIYIQKTGGGPVTSPLIFDELFSSTSGNSGTQYILNLQGTPAMPNGWDCGQAPYPNGASCTIAAADFNGTNSHRIDAYLSIPTAVLQKDDFQNCAQVRIGDVIVGSAECVVLDEATNDTKFDVSKACEASGERMIMGPNIWFQPYQCTLTVMTNGVPFTGPLWISEDLHFGQNSGAGSIQNITSSDPWDCAQPPYAPTGQGTSPYCGIQGNQFPTSGTSTLSVDMMMSSAMDTFGAENCVELSLGVPTATGLPAPIARDCVEIASAPQPSLDLSKTCEPAVRGADNQWTAHCVVIVSGAHLPAGHTVRITDELTGAGATTVSAGSFASGPFTQQNCGAFAVSGGIGGACDLSTDQITANGGEIALPYTAVLSAAGRFTNAPGQNCAAAEVPGLGLHAPATGNGKACVAIPLALTAIPGTGGINVGPILNPVTPAPTGCGFDTLFVIDQSGSMNLHNRLPLTKQALIAALNIFEGGGSTSGAITFNQTSTVIAGPSVVLPSAPLEAAILGVTAWGNEDWVVGMTAANTAVSGLTDKPLVLFIADGVPNRPVSGNITQNISAAVPALSALRSQGSRVVGIALGYSSVASGLSTFLGPNVVTAGGTVAIDPLTTDVIHIPSSDQIIPAFEAIAQAYCPNRQKMTADERASLMSVIQALPQPASVYMGDDEPPSTTQPAFDSGANVAPPNVPAPKPSLTLTKAQTAACTANRASQSYDCGFRLTVTNTGTGPYVGPLTVTDTVGRPGVRSAVLVSNNGWTCAGPVGDVMSCGTQLLNLAAGARTHLDLNMRIKGLRTGGDVENCGAVGIPDNRTQRISVLQHVMNSRGLNAGPVDGKPGQKTYAALSKLQVSLGLPVSTDVDDRLFGALGLPLQTAGDQSCVFAPLPPMPAPPLSCHPATTVKSGESCACRFDNMERRNATTCQCGGGFRFVKGKGCMVDAVPVPEPAPLVPDTHPLSCEKASTRLRGDQCVCRDQVNAKKVSQTQCRCTNGAPMIGGKCLLIEVKPRTPKPGKPDLEDDVAGAEKCRLKLNGICLK